MSGDAYGPVACRSLNCDGQCGLRSILDYGEEAKHLPAPPLITAIDFAQKHGLDSFVVSMCNEGVPVAVEIERDTSK